MVTIVCTARLQYMDYSMYCYNGWVVVCTATMDGL